MSVPAEKVAALLAVAASSLSLLVAAKEEEEREEVEAEGVERIEEVGIEAAPLIVTPRLSLERRGDPVCWLVDCFAMLAMTDGEAAPLIVIASASSLLVIARSEATWRSRLLPWIAALELAMTGRVGSVTVCNLAKLLLMLMSPLALRLSLFPELRDALVRVMLLLEFRERLLPEVIDPALTMFAALMVRLSLA